MCRRYASWFRRRTKRDVFIFISIIDIVLLIFFTLELTLAWGNGINGQFYGLIEKASASSGEGYTSEFEKNLTDFQMTVKDYGTIALTFFGFTFIGGIFDSKRDYTPLGKLSRFTTILIFIISICFLFCFMSLHLLYSFIYPYIIVSSDTIFLLLNIGLISFILSVNLLFFTLAFYLILIFISRVPKNDIVY